MRPAPALRRALTDPPASGPPRHAAELVARVAEAIGQPPIARGGGWSLECARHAPDDLDTEICFAVDGSPELGLRVSFEGPHAIFEPGSGEAADTVAGSAGALLDFFGNRRSSQALFLERAWRVAGGPGAGPAEVEDVHPHIRQLESLLPAPYELTSDIRTRVHANAARLGPQGEVAIRSDLAGADFIPGFVQTGTPVVLRGAVAGAAAWWSFDRIRETFAGAWTHLSRYPDCSFSIDGLVEKIVSGDPTAFKAALPVTSAIRAHYSVDAYFAPGTVFEKAQALLIAPADGCMPPTYRPTVWHRDWADNLLAQLVGAKKVRIVSPVHAERFDLRTTPACHYNVAVDHSAVDTRHPIERDGVAVADVTLEPGDLLFLPCGWLHTVENRTPTAAINCWRVRPPDMLASIA